MPVTQKRVKRHSDGFYYPERKVLFFWLPYEVNRCFRTLENAYRYLDKKHNEEIVALNQPKVEVFDWTPGKRDDA